MARAAAEAADGASEFAMRIFEPVPGRLEFAVRVGVICVATTLVGEIYGLPPELALAVYIVFFMNAPDRARSVLLGVVLTVLFTFLLAIVLVVSMQVIDHPTRKVLSIAFLSVALLFLGTASAIGEMAGTIVLIVGYGLDTLSRLPAGDLATRGTLYAWLFVGLPAPLSILINVAMAPSPRAVVQRRLAAGLRCAAKLFTSPDRAARRGAREWLRDLQETPKLLKLARVEHVSPAEDIDALLQSARSATSVLALARLADRDAEARLPAPTAARLAETLEEMAAIYADGGYPLDVTAPDVDLASLGPRAAAVTGEVRALLASFATPAKVVTVPPDPSAAPARRGFFRPDAFTNPEYVHHALKTTGAAMTCYVLYKTLDWQGIHTCFLTCYIVSLGTVGDSVEKLALRISGCLVGAAAGLGAIVFVVPHLTSITDLLLLVFAGTSMSAWVAGGRPQIAYAGLQMAFAFLLCVLQHHAPGFDMVTVRDRVLGILIGNAVAFVFFSRLWPLSVGGRIRDRTIAALRHLRALSGAATPAEGLTAAGLVQADLASIDEDLVLARLEPRSVRPDAAWIERHERAGDAIGTLCGALVIGTGRDSRAGASVGARLGALADAMEGRAGAEEPGARVPIAIPGAAGRPAWEPFRSDVEAGLGRLEDTLITRGEDVADAVPAGP
jgi:multidrug resistance protein MdtO